MTQEQHKFKHLLADTMDWGECEKELDRRIEYAEQVLNGIHSDEDGMAFYYYSSTDSDFTSDEKIEFLSDDLSNFRGLRKLIALLKDKAEFQNLARTIYLKSILVIALSPDSKYTISINADEKKYFLSLWDNADPFKWLKERKYKRLPSDDDNVINDLRRCIQQLQHFEKTE